MAPADSLILDAKQAILEEHHRRFQAFYKEGQLEEALKQFNTTIACASDLLTESLQLLERTLETQDQKNPETNPPQIPST